MQKLTFGLAILASGFGCKGSSPSESKESPAVEESKAEAGCDKGNAADCFEAGVSYDSPEIRRPDAVRAARYYDKACDLGNPTACDNLGGLLQSKGNAKDVALAFTLYRKACEAEYPVGCFHLGRAHETGSGTPASADQAAKLYERVCATAPDSGYPTVEKAVAAACFNLGVMKLGAVGIPADILEARRLLELGCTRGNADSCTALGVAVAKNGAGPADAKRGAELFKQGCDRGSTNGCYNLAVAYRDGDGVPVDDARSQEMFSKACDMGNAAACDQLKSPAKPKQ